LDRLTLFLRHFPVSASVLHAGALPGENEFPVEEKLSQAAGHLHVIRSGQYLLHLAGKKSIAINEPTVLYIPKPLRHRLQAVSDDETPTVVLCATIQLGDIAHDQVTDILPDVLLLPLTGVMALEQTLTLMFMEASTNACGKQGGKDSVSYGMLAGLADKRIAKTIVAIQENPGNSWNLDEMAASAGMSRTRFADHFKSVLGITPHQFLTSWRVALVQQRLKKGENFNQFAEEMGYSHPTALIRAFQQQTGLTPVAWAKHHVHQ